MIASCSSHIQINLTLMTYRKKMMGERREKWKNQLNKLVNPKEIRSMRRSAEACPCCTQLRKSNYMSLLSKRRSKSSRIISLGTVKFIVRSIGRLKILKTSMMRGLTIQYFWKHLRSKMKE